MQLSYPSPDPVLAQNVRPSEVNILFKHFYCFVNFETDYPNLFGASLIRLPCYDCSLEIHNQFHISLSKIYTYFQIKAPQNPNLFRRQMFKYIAYIRESPPVLICLIRSFHSSVNMPAAT